MEVLSAAAAALDLLGAEEVEDFESEAEEEEAAEPRISATKDWRFLGASRTNGGAKRRGMSGEEVEEDDDEEVADEEEDEDLAAFNKASSSAHGPRPEG